MPGRGLALEYYLKWYYIAVRELLAIGSFGSDYSAIARRLNPPILPAQAKKAIEVLLALGLITPDARGNYKAAERFLTSGSEIKSLIANFQRAMIGLAGEANDRHIAAHRNISTVTFSVSEATFDDIKAELDACRKRILGMVERSENVQKPRLPAQYPALPVDQNRGDPSCMPANDIPFNDTRRRSDACLHDLHPPGRRHDPDRQRHCACSTASGAPAANVGSASIWSATTRKAAPPPRPLLPPQPTP